MKYIKFNLSKTQVFLIALVLGLIFCNLLTTLSYNSQQKQISRSGKEVLQMLYEAKVKQKKDSIWYNQEIEKLSQLLYERETTNYQSQK